MRAFNVDEIDTCFIWEPKGKALHTHDIDTEKPTCKQKQTCCQNVFGAF